MVTPGEEFAFLRPIAARFRDDGPRLIYADYLDESDDPADHARADFIRVQVALARLPADHPRRPPLAERQAELRQRHLDDWTRPFDGLAAEVEFHRGIADSVAVDVGTFCDRGGELFRRGPIRRVRFTDAGRHVSRLAACSHLAEVRELVLCGAELGNGGVNVLLRSPHLARLEALDLSFNGVCDGGVWLIAKSRAVPRLSALSLNDNGLIGSEGAKALAASPHLARLRTLDLSGNDIGDGGMTALARSATLSRLSAVRIHANHIGDAGCESLAASPLLGRMLARDRRLDLRQNAITSAGVRALAASEHLAAAAVLDFTGNYIADDGLLALVDSPHTARLKKLLLRQNRIGDPAAVALARSPLMARLEYIDVSANRLTRRGLNELWKRRGDWHVEVVCDHLAPSAPTDPA